MFIPDLHQEISLESIPYQIHKSIVGAYVTPGRSIDPSLPGSRQGKTPHRSDPMGML